MLATLIPLFDAEMSVGSYSVFAQKANYFLKPGLNGTIRLDGAGNVTGMDLIDSMGIETLTGEKEVFVEINNISIFADLDAQCSAPHEKLVLLMDHTVKPEAMYINRVKELKAMGYGLAVRKLQIDQFEPYKPLLQMMDFILLDHKKIRIESARIYFSKQYPNIKLIAVNVDTQEEYDNLVAHGGYHFYEGGFFRMPIQKSEREIAPLKVNYIELLNVVNAPDYDLTDAADVVGRDTALVVSMLEMVNRMTIAGGVSSVRHAAAMLGQKELKKWINTAITKELLADKPSEIMRLSLLRAKFAENLAKIFELAQMSQELFLMGLFSVLDIMLDKTMDEALEIVKVSKPISDALLRGEGPLAPVLNFVKEYENASWQEVSRLMVLSNIDMDPVYEAYTDSLKWYRELFKQG
ncbi:MAG: HDOD domain-containing protein [Lachnospiraceae bacterium]|nr:HDOD domain-containing protein [Lachnospiraceae bacterium]